MKVYLKLIGCIVLIFLIILGASYFRDTGYDFSANIFERKSNQWIAFCFALFILMIIIFSIIYYSIFKRDPESFLFGAALFQGQQKYISIQLDKKLAKLNSAIKVLEYIIENFLKSEKDTIEIEYDKNYSLDDSISFAFHSSLRTVGSHVSFSYCIYSIYIYKDGEFLDSICRTDVDYSDLNNLKKNIYEGLSLRKKEYYSIKTNPEYITKNMWSYLDFLYFSLITQTTVGYGDILPNNTKVRCLVSTQIIFSYVVIILMLNIIFTSS